MRLDCAGGPRDPQQDEKQYRQSDAYGERTHHFFRFALVVDQMKKPGSEAGYDRDQTSNDKYLDHGGRYSESKAGGADVGRGREMNISSSWRIVS